MNWLSLPRLWLASAMLVVAALALARLSCQRASPLFRPARDSLALAPPATFPKKPAPASRQGQPSYTYVGRLAPPRSPAADTGVSAPIDTVNAKAPHDSALSLARQQALDPATGEIPDLFIDLAGNDLYRVMARYGYVLAIKSRNRLLGKIVGQRFQPLRREELARYAWRGRSAAQHPQAARWVERVAQELEHPAEELTAIFLVPLETEKIFIAAELAAVERAGKTPAEIALVRACFDTNLAIVVRELVTKNGATIAIDSLPIP